MLKIQTKTITLKAWLWDETKSTFKETGCRLLACTGHGEKPDLMQNLKIETVTGNSNVKKGDYIVEDPLDGFFVCDAESIEKNYSFELKLYTREDLIKLLDKHSRNVLSKAYDDGVLDNNKWIEENLK